MPEINKKYIEDFETLVRDFERLKQKPNADALNMVMQDLEQMQRDMQNIKF
ncbi:MAG: hypothetical protein K1000chlam2_01611 [Chlamydiae bacterium]|nr:hypothetical protein [Chlamydiota bacterium]